MFSPLGPWLDVALDMDQVLFQYGSPLSRFGTKASGSVPPATSGPHHWVPTHRFRSLAEPSDTGDTDTGWFLPNRSILPHIWTLDRHKIDRSHSNHSPPTLCVGDPIVDQSKRSINTALLLTSVLATSYLSTQYISLPYILTCHSPVALLCHVLDHILVVFFSAKEHYLDIPATDY